MQSLILIALMQAAMGEPAAPPPEQIPAAESTPSAPAQPAAPRTERRRVCTEYPAATGGRLQHRRCRWEEVVVETPAPEEAAQDATDHSQHSDAPTGGGAPAGAATPAPQTP
jgi:hypothetical protein